MRKIAIAALLALSGLFAGCAAGPHQLQRTVDDWDHKMYVESPWIDAVLYIIPVIPLARYGAAIGDFFVTDAYAFWLNDAFGGDGGTGFRHKEVASKRSMGSLLRDDGKFLKIDGGM
ncbi:MAG: hypothetical protein AB7I19_15180 [Planctomycetota bacterium]|jgi:hypothetical protein